MNRILDLKKDPDADGTCVLYVMSRDQRVRDNHAILAAQAEALEHNIPLAVVFNFYPKLGHRRREHFEFMVDGLREIENELMKKNIPFIKMVGDMPKNCSELARDTKPRSIYFDFSPLRHARFSQKELAEAVDCRVRVVDTHNVVPTWVVSDKEEFAAHTFRPKLHKCINEWTVEPPKLKKHPYSFAGTLPAATWKEVDAVISKLPKSGIAHGFISGETAARQHLQAFIETGLKSYANDRNDANKDAQSNLSPYLHYGQLSALRILLEVLDKKTHLPQLFTSPKMPIQGDGAREENGIDSFVEELIVRKELSDNFCFYNPRYDSLDGARDWAKKTLAEHTKNPREFTYTLHQLEQAKTHNDLWNAAQTQLIRTGKIHGYMRMYWAKKILEWTNDPAIAVKRAIQLNDSYHLDGGDPSGYVGILWSIAGVHDRPWFDREIFGTVRYMAERGAKKKFDIAKYIEHWK